MIKKMQSQNYTIIRLKLRAIASYVLQMLFYKCRVKKKIVFSNFNGKGYGDNPKYIADEIIKQGLDYEMVWLVNDMSCSIPLGIRKVKIKSVRSVYELSTAKIIINNVKNRLSFIKKDNQFYIQTWHGGFPLKYIEKEVEDQLDSLYVSKSKEESSITDLLLSASKSDSEIFKNAFWYKGELLEKGIPRNDILFRDNTDLINTIRNLLGIENGNKVALYAPTFRDDDSTDVYSIDCDKIIESLEKKSNNRWTLVVRLHPNVKNSDGAFHYGKCVVNGSVVEDPMHMVVASDLLITDYSSMMMDFSLMRKPVFLFAPDLKSYSNSRGLRPVFFELPFHLSENNEDLCDSIIKTDFDCYLSKADEFVKNHVKSYDDGHASEVVVARIKQEMNRSFFEK